MTKRVYKAPKTNKAAGRKPGTFLGVRIVDPAVRPKTTTVKIIRDAVRAVTLKTPPAL